MNNMIKEQIELEKEMLSTSCQNYDLHLVQAKQNGSFGSTDIATKLIQDVLDLYSKCIENYLKNKPLTLCSIVIKRLGDIDTVAFLASKIILNSIWGEFSVQSVYKAIGQALESEYKMKEYKFDNMNYYNKVIEDLNKRNAKPCQKSACLSAVFDKKLNFHIEKWTAAEKFQTGLVLVNIFVKISNLVRLEDVYFKSKHTKILIPTKKLVDSTDNLKERFQVMQPFFLPMICPPKKWTSIFEGGYITPFVAKNKLIKNNDRDYLKKLKNIKIPIVYEAVNTLQETQWQINKRVLDVVKDLWQEGQEGAGIPAKYDIEPPPFPDSKSASDMKEAVKKWKREAFEIHKKNIQNRSLRLLFSQILKIAIKFEEYEKIWFPYQMDFRGRLYPIPVLLNPQGSDLSKGLLRFAQGKPIDKSSIKWLKIHGANLWGYDKESYEDRIKLVDERHIEIQSYAKNPLQNRGWMEADKPFQFLAFCFEYSDYLDNPENFLTHIPILLDGTCNGLQHYSALLRDYKGGCAVNLVNSDKPNDIYSTVADRLKEKLQEVKTSQNSSAEYKKLADCWLTLGINRKLTKRPVMVLPYGGTMLSCREYIGQYLTDTYQQRFLQNHFKICDNPNDCLFKSSVWLSKYLWKSIQETLNAATVGMDFIRKIAKITTRKKKFIEWVTPLGLPVRQNYNLRKGKEIKTELYGSILKTNVNIDLNIPDSKRQISGICPNFIHSLDAACLMLYIVKCKKSGIKNFMTIHDCYGTLASDTDVSVKMLREAFVEIYKQPVLENFAQDILQGEKEIPKLPQKGSLDIEEVLKSKYFFN